MSIKNDNRFCKLFCGLETVEFRGEISTTANCNTKNDKPLRQMPPTFLIFLGLIVYMGVTAVTFVVFVPMLFIDSKKLLAKKVLATVLISFPCLIATGLFLSLVFLIPALTFSWLANNNYIAKTPGIVFAIIGALTFAGSVAVCSLYIWYFTSKIIYQRLDKKPVSDFLDSDKLFNFLRPYLIKLKLFRDNLLTK